MPVEHPRLHPSTGNTLLMRPVALRSKLDLAENGITDVGAQAMARALRQSSGHMTHLDLANNNINPDHLDAISKCKEAHACVRECFVLACVRNAQRLCVCLGSMRTLHNSECILASCFCHLIIDS